MLHLTWEPDAADQLVEAIEYIAAKNRSAALRLEQAFYDRLQTARSFPAVGRPGRVDGTRELIVHPNYLVVYQVTVDAIDVLRVLHSRQRYP